MSTSMNADEFWDYCHRPENANRSLDLSRGRVIEWQGRTRVQAVVAGNVGYALHKYQDAARTGFSTLACGVTLGSDRETVRGVDAAYFHGPVPLTEHRWDTDPPRLAVHIRGPQDSASEIVAKVEDFLNNGTLLVWVIDPLGKQVVIHRVGLPPLHLGMSDMISGFDSLPDLYCRVDHLFTLPGERQNTP